ncbi:excalibur calcium-binding domain-containing protein [Ruegeria denitrificans]
MTGLDSYDCSDFPNGAAAQKFFLASGGPITDPRNLDGDGDGLACEWRAQILKMSTYRRPAPAVRRSYSNCYTGPRGGTYTITATGNKNYGGC